MTAMMRIGEGWDVHALVPGRALVVGGVVIDHPQGLLGHSDADVLLHAIIDALLGAAALGDIGSHFPDSDVQHRGADCAGEMVEAELGRTAGVKNGIELVEMPDAVGNRHHDG